MLRVQLYTRVFKFFEQILLIVINEKNREQILIGRKHS